MELHDIKTGRRKPIPQWILRQQPEDKVKSRRHTKKGPGRMPFNRRK